MLGEGLSKGVSVWRNGNGANAARRPADQPAPTVHFGNNMNSVEWVHERPATNVNGDPRISAPGHHDENESGSQQKDAVRVTVQEASVLQSFPADYPWQGSRTSKFRQIGNAVPPLLAKAILSALLGINELEEAA